MVELRGREPLLGGATLFGATLDLSDLTWLTPFDTVSLAAYAMRFSVRERSLDVIGPSDDRVRAYVDNTLLGEVLELPSGKRSPDEDPLVPLTHLRRPDEWDDRLEELWPAVRRRVGNYEVSRALFDVLGELIDNAVTHGRSDVGTFVCVQHYTGRTSQLPPGIWAGVADAGVGIPRHLRGNSEYAAIEDDQELIRLARRPWVTGTRDRRGWGLVEVFEAAAVTGGGELLIRSGRAEGRFLVRPGRPPWARYRALPRAAVGTSVHVRMDEPA